MSVISADIVLRGAGGEPVDLRRTLLSHGLASLPPMQVREDGTAASITLRSDRSVRTLHITASQPHVARVKISVLAVT